MYLSNFDKFNSYLFLDLASGKSQVEVLSSPPNEDVRLRGLFVKEQDFLVGMYASRKGPVVFHGEQFWLCELGRVAAKSESTSFNKRNFVFRLDGHDVFSIDYTPREGVGTNPYDQELSDVDLFALIEKNLASPQFFKNYVDAHVPSPIVSGSNP
jgi:hypothetical protein